MPKLGQIFYGRSKDGYSILGASPSGRPFVGFVAALCRAVGSPDRPGDIQPFLINKRESSSVIMIRACRGDADPTGRSTLFFHALVTAADDLAVANLDAFILAEKGAFLSTLPENIKDVEITALTSQANLAPSEELCFPAFIASDHPLDIEARHALGRESLSRNWTTYSYRALNGFDLCIHSSYASAPVSGNRYTLENRRFVIVDSSRTVTPNPHQSSFKKNTSSMLKVSLFANVILAVVLVAAFAVRNGKDGNGQKSQLPPTSQIDQSSKQKSNLSTETTKEEAFAKWGKDWEAEFRHRLRLSFEKCFGNNRRIIDFEKEMLLVDSYYEDYKSQKANPPTPQTLDIYAALKAYVSFVETEVITTNQGGGNDENNKSKR